MKKFRDFLRIGIMLTLTVIVNSCSKSEPVDVSEKFTGSLKLSVGLSYKVDTYAETYATTSELKVDIFKKGNDIPVKSYENYSEVPEVIVLPEGEYYVVAYNKENPDAAFEKPYFYGKSGVFSIKSEETSSVSVTCKLNNIMVSIVYSNRVITSFTDYTTTVSNKNGSLTFAKNENRAGYFNAGPLELNSVLTYQEEEATKTKTLTGNLNAQKGSHYTINVDTYPGESGTGAGIAITIDENVETVVVDLTDEGATIPGGGGSGELLITEIMYNPKALTDATGEWIEVFNNSGSVINMKDYVYKRGNVTTVYKVTEDILVQPGSYVVFGRNTDATDNVAYVTTWVNLPNNGATLIIASYGTDGTDGDVICSFEYGTEESNSAPEGASIQLDPSIKDVDAARLASNWCAATVAYSTGDLGTPGLANTPCR